MLRYVRHALLLLGKGAMQYRSSLLMQVLAQFVMTGGELLAVVVVLTRFTTVGQWSGPEIFFYFGMMQCAFSLTEMLGRGVTAFPYFVQRGEFDALLLRPRPLLVQTLVSQIDLRRAGSFLVGAVSAVAAFSRLQLVWTAGKVLLLLWSLLGSVMLVLGLFLIEATMSFFSVKSIEMVNILTYGGRSACQYPVDIFPTPLRLLFTWVAPFGMCMHWPVSYLLGRPLAGLAPTLLGPAAGVVVFAAMTALWYAGARRYRSTGS